MKNIYDALKWFGRLKSPRLRLLGVLCLHVTGRRYMGIFLDPVLACNFRCRMCYFSDEKRRRELHGVFTPTDLEAIGKALFHRALKLQIGCGAEPTLCKDLPALVALGRRYGVPYISLTTNGNLLDEEKLRALAEAGLNELTLSVHGLTADTYERLMTGGRFGKFLQLLADWRNVKRDYPHLRLRVNYTMNTDNVAELADFSRVFSGIDVDVLQLRPIQHIGDSAYQDFSLDRIEACYDSVVRPLMEEYRRRGTVCLVPTRDNLKALKQEEDTHDASGDLTYCHVAPGSCWQPGFDFRRDTFESYCKRTRRVRFMLKQIFKPGGGKAARRKERTRRLNYSVK